MLLKPLSIAALLAVAELSACQRDDDPARLWSGQTAETVRTAGRAPGAAVQAAQTATVNAAQTTAVRSTLPAPPAKH